MRNNEIFAAIKEYVAKAIEAPVASINISLDALKSGQEEIKTEDEIVQIVQGQLTDIHSDNKDIDAKVKSVNEMLSVLLSYIDEYKKEMAYSNTVIAEHKDTITVQAEQIEGLQNNIKELKESLPDMEVKILLHQDKNFNHVEEKLTDIENTIDGRIEALSEKTFKLFDDKVENIDLKLSNTQSKELLKINDRVANSLNVLKGEKGDVGEKGQQGESGGLSRVSPWENGYIAKKDEVVSFRNGLWLCKDEQTAIEPVCGDVWTLINDGITNCDISGSNLVLKFASGKDIDLGRVGIVHKGDFDHDVIYKRNDVVLKNKSSFISLMDNNTDHPPGKSWRLVAGKGVKGDVGAIGKQGEKGDSGCGPNPEDLIPVIEEVVTKKLGKG